MGYGEGWPWEEVVFGGHNITFAILSLPFSFSREEKKGEEEGEEKVLMVRSLTTGGSISSFFSLSFKGDSYKEEKRWREERKGLSEQG